MKVRHAGREEDQGHSPLSSCKVPREEQAAATSHQLRRSVITMTRKSTYQMIR